MSPVQNGLQAKAQPLPKPLSLQVKPSMAYLHMCGYLQAGVETVPQWELLEIIERDGVLVESNLFRPLGDFHEMADDHRIAFHPENNTAQLIRAVLLDGFEPVSQSVILLSDGSLQKHWLFRLQVMAD